MLTVSPAFRQSTPPNETQKLLLLVLAVFVAPLPFYLLTGPKYTVRTKEFFLSLLLTLLVPFGGFLYAVYFICVALPLAVAGEQGYVRISDDLESGEVCGECEGLSETQSSAPAAKNASDSLPSYEEVEGSSNGATRAPVDTKFTGDNKVQH